VTTERSQEDLLLLKNREHPNCFLCGPANNSGLHLAFRACAEGSVAGRFSCDQIFQGYAGFLHGGVIASLLDSAMVSRLFSQGKAPSLLN